MNKSREKNFLKSTIIITIGKVCTQLVTFLLLPLYTSLLSTDEYGMVDLLNTLVMLLLPIITLQLEAAAFRDLTENRGNLEIEKKIISTSLITIIAQIIFYFILYLIISPFINNKYKIFLLVNVIAYVLCSVFLQYSRGLGDNKKYAIGSFISATSTILFNVLFLVVFKYKVNGMLLGTFMGQLFGFGYIFFSLKLYKYISIKAYDKKIKKSLLKYSVPLIPNSLSWWVFGVSDRFIVSVILGLSSTGLLSIGNKFPSIITYVYNIIYLSLSENLIVYSNDKDISSYFNKMFNVILNFFVVITIMLIACMPFVFKIMINKDYNGAYNIIPILSIANVFNVLVSMLGILYAVNKDTKTVANTSIIAAIINILVHLSLIKFIGLYAAAISTFASYFIMSIYRLYTTDKKYFKIELDSKMIIINSILMVISLVIYYLNVDILTAINIIVSSIVLLIVNRKYLGILSNLLKNKLLKVRN